MNTGSLRDKRIKETNPRGREKQIFYGQIVNYKISGKHTAFETATRFGVDTSTVFRILKKYKQQGELNAT